MSAPDRARLRALSTAALLLVSGALIGILTDRVVLRPTGLEATPLTVDGMVDRLGLSVPESERVRVLLDSLHTELAALLLESPDSLRSSVHEIRERIESALPERARGEFREWMLEHHRSMVRGHGPLHGAP